MVVDTDVSGQYIGPIRKSQTVPGVIRGKLRPQSHCGGSLQYLIFNIQKIQCVSVEIYKSLDQGTVFFGGGGGGPFYRLASRFRESVPVNMLRRAMLTEFEVGTLKLELNVTVN